MKLNSKQLSAGIGAGVVALIISASAFSFIKEETFKGTIPVQKENKIQLAELARISIQEAMAKSSKAVPGKIIEIVLEKENGFLIYEAEIVAADKSRKEVVLDAGTGEVLQIKDKH